MVTVRPLRFEKGLITVEAERSGKVRVSLPDGVTAQA